jgi:large subunit ribosomal protein L30
MAKARAKKSAPLRIRQVRSAIGRPPAQHEALRGLGLRHPHHVVERQDTPAVRGLIAKIPHLVELIEDE